MNPLRNTSSRYSRKKRTRNPDPFNHEDNPRKQREDYENTGQPKQRTRKPSSERYSIATRKTSLD
jgi:hypothetical protein